MSNFLEQLSQAFADSMFYTVGAPVQQQIDWTQIGALLLSKFVVTLILITVFSLIYVGLRRALQLIEQRVNLHADWFTACRQALRFFWLLAVVIAVLSQAGMQPASIQAFARAAIASLVFYVFWVITIRFLGKALRRFHLEQAIEQLLRNILSVMIVVLGFAAVLAQFGFNIVSIVAGLGIVGLAVGFAAQSTLANFIAGITILMERPFRIGDWVRINNNEGKIIRIALRTTHLKTRDNISVIIPNQTVASSVLVNLTARPLSRFDIECRIGYAESVTQAREVITARLADFEQILHTPEPMITTKALGDFGVILLVRFWLSPEMIERLPIICEQVIEEIKSALNEANIEIPYPHMRLLYPQPVDQ
ncbi:MAG: mechanosensitive ion channel family protein [Pseudomonadota bacterium]|nr:mechanosensitive ion channel family protein [Pseudomonadota bacterium]